ncbi:MAG: hypothetical protein GF405_02795 [Candidatus Eisenbacteria bacterium]|nr:hypothetical protein [Candidatus Eisenbacteria bacterium]
MSHEWSNYWQDARNLRWSIVDQIVLDRVATVLGWGPDRTLLELGAGRGLHSHRLFELMRCERPDLYEVNPEMLRYMERMGFNAIGDDADLKHEYDIVWSYGVPEHFEEPMRQEIIDRHFELSRDWVLLVIPRKTWLRRSVARTDRIPARDFTDEELRDRLKRGAERHWKKGASVVVVEHFCPLFGIRHIDDSLFPVVEALTGWALPGGLLIGWGRREAGGD